MQRETHLTGQQGSPPGKGLLGVTACNQQLQQHLHTQDYSSLLQSKATRTQTWRKKARRSRGLGPDTKSKPLSLDSILTNNVAVKYQ